MIAKHFMRELEAEILNHPFLSHSFVHRLSAPECVTREQARRFALLYYPHIFRTRQYQANALGICPDERIQFALAQIVFDEFGNGEMSQTHPAVYRKFMRALDISDSEIAAAPIIPELSVYIDSMMRLTQSGDWLSAVAAVGIASEWPIPRLYTSFLKGLRTVPGLKEDDLELFISHVGLDEEHSKMMREAMLPHAYTLEQHARIGAGIRANLDARGILFSGLDREVFGTK